MKKLQILLFSSLLLSGCGMLWQYRSINEIEDHIWLKNDVQSFEMDIDEPKTLDVYLLFRHVYGFPYDNVPMQIDVIKDDVKIESLDYELAVIGEDREYLGEGSVDLWDLEALLFPSMKLEPGHYQFNIQHTASREKLELVMEVGLMMKKTEGNH